MNIRGKKITVVGMGRTSMALVRLLLREGALPWVTEISDGEQLAQFKQELKSLGVPYECGGHTDEALLGAAWVVPSPGVPPETAPVRRAVEGGAELVGELELASHFCRSKVLAVTGTNGKTTTTELIRCLVERCGSSVVLAGNNAFPFSAAVMVDPAPEYVVLEVSSYQLETARTFRPWIGAILNVTPDHLARHATMERYTAVKGKLFANQQKGDHAVVNYDDHLTRFLADSGSGAQWLFSLKTRLDQGLWLDGETIRHGDTAVASVSDTALPGRHNLENVLAALSVMRAGGFPWEPVLEGLRSFGGVEHRIEHVTTIGGTAFYNDSKSTNVDSLKVALESFDCPVVLIAGGRGKGSDYGVLAKLVARSVSTLVTLGEDAPLLEEAFGADVPVVHTATMEEAVAKAASATGPGGIVLLSPGCASFDLFENFEHRGRAFKECVQRLARGAGNGKGD